MLELKSLVLITVDCLRRDRLGAYGYPIRTSPFIDKLASEGTIFTNAFSNGGGTPEAFPSLLLGDDPPSHWEQYGTSLKGGLPEYFKNRGYATGAFHSNPYVSRFYGYERNFDVFKDGFETSDSRVGVGAFHQLKSIAGSVMLKLPRLPFPVPEALGDELISNFVAYHRKKDATTVTNEAINWLTRIGRPVFLWIHYMDAHMPYLPYSRFFSVRPDRNLSPQRLLSTYMKVSRGYERLAEESKEDLVAFYDCSIRYVDSEIGRLLAHLREPQDTVIVTADHGEAFGDHGRFGHLDVHEEIIHVPLIIKSGLESAPKISRQFVCSRQLCEIATSLFERNPRLQCEQVNEVISVAMDPVKRERIVSLRTPKWKYVRTDLLDLDDSVRDAKQELFDVESDSKETINLADQFPNVISEYGRIVERAIESKSTTKRKNEDHLALEDEAEIKQRLERLGYL